MNKVDLEILVVRILFSIIGIVGNMVLIHSIVQSPICRLKSFEVFLLGLAMSNLEMILVVDVYDIIMLQYAHLLDVWSCRTLKFLTVFGEVGSILFTVLISIFRYQKLRDTLRRVNFPIFLDNIRSAWLVSGLCVVLSILLGVPTYVIDLDHHMYNLTRGRSPGCPPDFFQCHKENCPFFNRFYKYMFLFVCNLLPLFIITVTSCLVLKSLWGQKRIVIPALSASGSAPPGKMLKGPRFQKSAMAILVAMGVFQVDWTIYLILHLAFSPADLPTWSELEFFITTSYTTISPYVYGIGNNFFSSKHFCKK